MGTPTQRVTRDIVVRRGWRPGTTLEDEVACQLSRLGFLPEQVAQQYHVGAYRLDFAIPDLKVAIEADGWHHGSPSAAAHDAERDSWLRSQGWVVFRVDDRYGTESLADQLVRPARFIRSEWASAGSPNARRFRKPADDKPYVAA